MKKQLSYYLIILSAAIIGFGFIFMACLSSFNSLQKFGNTNYFIFHQFLYAILPGLILAAVAYKVSLEKIKKWAPILVFANLALLFSVFIPGIGLNAKGASRWIDIGFTSFQPSEFLKITAILYLSAWIASKLSETNASDWKTVAKKGYHNIIYIFVPFVIFLGLISVALILQSDASTLGIISITLLILYFSARTPLWHTLLTLGSGLTILLLLIRFEPYRFDRWLIFLHPNTDPLGAGFQLRQSLISLGSGGIFGKGLGLSTQKYRFLPEAMTDSIFAVIGEELGIIGAVAIIICFILFIWLGIKIARNSNDRFARMVAVGVVVWITFQAFINISSAVGLFPLAGIPLPFFSYGGSHIVVEMIGLGLLLNISKNT